MQMDKVFVAAAATAAAIGEDDMTDADVGGVEQTLKDEAVKEAEPKLVLRADVADFDVFGASTSNRSIE
jgi:hypothetical protein